MSSKKSSSDPEENDLSQDGPGPAPLSERDRRMAERESREKEIPSLRSTESTVSELEETIDGGSSDEGGLEDGFTTPAPRGPSETERMKEPIDGSKVDTGETDDRNNFDSRNTQTPPPNVDAELTIEALRNALRMSERNTQAAREENLRLAEDVTKSRKALRFQLQVRKEEKVLLESESNRRETQRIENKMKAQKLERIEQEMIDSLEWLQRHRIEEGKDELVLTTEEKEMISSSSMFSTTSTFREVDGHRDKDVVAGIEIDETPHLAPRTGQRIPNLKHLEGPTTMKERQKKDPQPPKNVPAVVTSIKSPQPLLNLRKDRKTRLVSGRNATGDDITRTLGTTGLTARLIADIIEEELGKILLSQKKITQTLIWGIVTDIFKMEESEVGPEQAFFFVTLKVTLDDWFIAMQRKPEQRDWTPSSASSVMSSSFGQDLLAELHRLSVNYWRKAERLDVGKVNFHLKIFDDFLSTLRTKYTDLDEEGLSRLHRNDVNRSIRPELGDASKLVRFALNTNKQLASAVDAFHRERARKTTVGFDATAQSKCDQQKQVFAGQIVQRVKMHLISDSANKQSFLSHQPYDCPSHEVIKISLWEKDETAYLEYLHGYCLKAEERLREAESTQGLPPRGTGHRSNETKTEPSGQRNRSGSPLRSRQNSSFHRNGRNRFQSSELNQLENNQNDSHVAWEDESHLGKAWCPVGEVAEQYLYNMDETDLLMIASINRGGHNSAQQTAQATGLAELFCSSIDMTASDFIDETQNDDVGIIAMTQWEGKMGNDLDLIDARNEAGARYIWRNPQNRNQEVTKAKFLELMSLPIIEGGWGLKLKTGAGSIINLAYITPEEWKEFRKEEQFAIVQLRNQQREQGIPFPSTMSPKDKQKAKSWIDNMRTRTQRDGQRQGGSRGFGDSRRNSTMRSNNGASNIGSTTPRGRNSRNM